MEKNLFKIPNGEKHTESYIFAGKTTHIVTRKENKEFILYRLDGKLIKIAQSKKPTDFRAVVDSEVKQDRKR